MSVTEHPSATLRRAAEKLRKLSEGATDGPWGHMCLGSEGCLVLVGLALADLLERFAECGCDEDGDHWPEKSAALAVARAVLGEPEGGQP